MSIESSRVAASYAPGGSTAVACEGFWLLADVRHDDPSLDDLWEAVRSGSPDQVSDLAASLAAGGKLGGGFVSLRESKGAFVIATGGSATATVGRGAETELLSCPAGVDQAEYRLHSPPDAVSVALQDDQDAARLPLARGVAPANCLQLTWSGGPADAVVTPTPSTEPDDVEPQVPVPSAVEPVSIETVTPSTISADTITAKMEGAEEHDPLGDPADALSGTASASPVLTQGPDSGYEFLFGQTVHRSVTDAAIHPTGETVVEEQEPPPKEVEMPEPSAVAAEESPRPPAPAPRALAATPATPKPPPVLAKTSGMIDSVPWSGDPPETDLPESVPGPAEPASATAGDEEDDDDSAVGLTISRAKQQEILRQLSSDAASGSSGPSVHAVRCPTGHPNPAHAGECRVCKLPIEDQSPVTLPRPVLGVLRFSTGDVITLDRGVLIGRKPSTTKNVGSDRPHVVKLPSPEQDISRNHLEIRLDDWHVLVTDLNSTNGTVITRPGREPERLRPEQATMIEPGTVVDLAEVVSFTFDATE